MNSAEQELLGIVRAFNDAFAANDPDTYFTFVDDGLTLFLPSGPYRIEGKPDDREEFEFCLRRGWTKVGFFQELQPLVQLYGEVAVVSYYSRGAYGEGTNEKLKYFKETNVWVRRPEGWKIAHIHLSNAG